MMELIGVLTWHLGLTYSPSKVLINGHGYSWLGKKARGLHDVDVAGLIREGYLEGYAEALEAQAKSGFPPRLG